MSEDMLCVVYEDDVRFTMMELLMRLGVVKQVEDRRTLIFNGSFTSGDLSTWTSNDQQVYYSTNRGESWKKHDEKL